MSVLYRVFTLILFFLTMLANTGCENTGFFRKKVDPYAPAKPEPEAVIQKYNGAIYQEGMTVGLFDNRTARQKGDILTIELVESASASASSSTTTKKTNSVDLPSPTEAGDKETKDGKEVLSNQFEGGRDFNGAGNTSQKHDLSGKITVTVAEVLPNRNLVVRGEKLLNLNQADE